MWKCVRMCGANGPFIGDIQDDSLTTLNKREIM
jgi:hypothetical protein